MKFILMSLAALVFVCPTDSFGECLKGDCVNGQGTMSFVHGGRYTGQFKNGQLHGHGTLVTAEGTRYIGSFKDNKFHGKGTVIFPDGRKYEDHFKDGRMRGRGKTTFLGIRSVDQHDDKLGATAALAFQDLAKWQRHMIINSSVIHITEGDRTDVQEKTIDPSAQMDSLSLKGWYVNKGKVERFDWDNEITANSNVTIEKEIKVGTQKYNMYMEPDYTFDNEAMGSNWGLQLGIRLPFPE